jgi:Transcriptional regulator, AbiEi antitoxin
MPVAALPHPFLRADALAAGVSERRLDGMLDRGVLTRVAPGVYALSTRWEASPPWDRHLGLARAAVRATPNAIISHASAAALLGLPMPPKPPQRATMTLLHDTRTSAPDGWRQFHRGHTPPSQIVIDRGHPYLVPARTVIDCMREMKPADALAVLDAALRRGLVTGPELLDMRGHQRRWPGITAADRILRCGDGLRESWFESRSAWVMADWGLPRGIPQVVVSDSGGRFVGRVDALWPELGVVGEADGQGKYLLEAIETDRPPEEGAARAVVAQAVRESRLRDLGLEVVRWDPTDLAMPLTLVERFHAAVARARPGFVTARYTCSCCRRPLTDCEIPTRIRGPGARPGG